MEDGMDDAMLERLKGEMEWEFARTGPPEGFPPFHDIPVGRYLSDDFYELERTRLWARTWVLAGRAEDVPRPGDYMRFDRLGVPILIVRGRDGLLRGYYNTCQHRGAPVVRDEVGSARTLRCQYHSWTYDIDDGRLVHVPDQRDFVDLDTSERCLPTVRCEVWDGWVFVNQDSEAPALLDWLGPVAEQLADFQGAALREVARRSEIVPCNWKVTAEAFLEVYHFKHIHSHGGDSYLDNRGATMGLLPNGHSRMITPFTPRSCTAAGMASWSDWKPIEHPGFADIETVDDMVRSTSTAYGVFPNLITPLAAHGFPFLLFWPLDRTTTLLEWIHYAPMDWEAGELPDCWKERLDRFDVVMEEDCRNMEPMQRSLQSPAMRGVPISYQERRIWHFHEEIDRVIGIDVIDSLDPALRVAPLLSTYVTD
jgi:phenylpropionate dioxygenase-like ring-hydroxylating dioxygenase large terminal subunit